MSSEPLDVYGVCFCGSTDFVEHTETEKQPSGCTVWMRWVECENGHRDARQEPRKPRTFGFMSRSTDRWLP